ncbi:hypothetical protein RRG08_043136 [Elysia crispata]|uniref:SMB domain-containing protein n=1 Tax=Elysia crispata TaxID=231223 RepID=A0AAE0YMQ8_9GAST|nr:hypothetical protein RRG08_043136 [Elysia crispata]
MLIVTPSFLLTTIALQQLQWCHHTRSLVDSNEIQPHLSLKSNTESTSGDGPDPGNQSEEPIILPWYLNDLAGLNESLYWSNRTYSEFLDFKTMLYTINGIVDHPMLVSEIGKIPVGNFTYEMVLGPEIKAFSSELDVCSQPDILKRISCRDRCGQQPESLKVQAQCGCDQDCFINNDCCEDLNKFCMEIFVQATTKFYQNYMKYGFPPCYEYEKSIFFNIYESERLYPSAGPRVFEINCYSEIYKDEALKNIYWAMVPAGCTFTNVTIDKGFHSRICDRPDVLVCGSGTSPNEFTLYPIPLLCFGHALTTRLYARYNFGPDGMEVIAQRGNCFHLRQTARGNTDILTNDNSKKNVWQKYQRKKIFMTVVTRNGQTFFNFESAKWKNLRSAGGMDFSDWGCEVYECLENQLDDERSKSCYSPNYAYVQITEFNRNFSSSLSDAQEVRSNSDSCIDNNNISISVPHNPEEKPLASLNVQLCSCLKALAVLRSVNLWQVLVDKSALVDGRCGSRLAAQPQDQLVFSRIEADGNGSRNWNDTALPGASAIGDTRLDTAQAGSVYSVSFLSHQLPFLWNNYRNECTEEEYRNVEICLSNTVLRDLETICFTLQDTSPEIVDSCVRGLYNMEIRHSLRYDCLLSLLIVYALNLIITFIE